MASKKLLIIEDNPEYQLFLKALLQQEGDVENVNSVNQARMKLKVLRPDLIVLDIGLGRESGFEFCSELKARAEWKEIPIVFLSVREETHLKVAGLSMGADDYIVKSSDPLEIHARVKAALRRHKKNFPVDNYTHGGVRVDFSAQRAYLVDEKEEVSLDLTPTEFKILVFLVRHEGEVLSRQRLLDEVWAADTQPITGRTVDTHVHALRKKMGPQAQRIESVFGAGYRYSSSTPLNVE
jgi:DNA-binding response OmpR family regulator